MSRPMLLVCLLLVLIITSQFEWRQQLVNDIDPTPGVSHKQQQISKREEAVKEKIIHDLLQIILSQEKNIHKLNELIQSLRQQLSQCRCHNETANGTASSWTEHAIELERQQIVKD
ncbi:hypothetical protein Tsubulata_036034 [Turnera subulata]|uniref:Uncharacterized protein n=1 Tax=Turnera subulata TaxID=218843 RepID=A0A9Q0IZ17_9ROSI|nr:hypothetical protein Tsubulata_036034 [Turnera subulata]